MSLSIWRKPELSRSFAPSTVKPHANKNGVKQDNRGTNHWPILHLQLPVTGKCPQLVQYSSDSNFSNVSVCTGRIPYKPIGFTQWLCTTSDYISHRFFHSKVYSDAKKLVPWVALFNYWWHCCWNRTRLSQLQSTSKALNYFQTRKSS